MHTSVYLPPRDPVRIVEVSPRDGLQNIPHQIPTSTKLELIHRLLQTGLTTIELTSIVSPRAVPQLADARDVLSHENIRSHLQHAKTDSDSDSCSSSGYDSGSWSDRSRSQSRSRSSSSSSSSLSQQYEQSTLTTKLPLSKLTLPVLIPNLKGLDIALSHNTAHIAVFVSASEAFSRTNTNCSVSSGLCRAREVTVKAKKAGVQQVRGYISCIFTDPISNTRTPMESVYHCTAALLEAGVDEVALSDTTGTGTPGDVLGLVGYLTSAECGIPVERLAAHFHDSYGRGLPNVWAAYEAGIRVFDGSVAGLGGCPFAPGAKGNVATEEVVGLFEGRGVRTGVDLDRLGEVAGWVAEVMYRYRVGIGDGDGEKGGRCNGTICPTGYGR